MKERQNKLVISVLTLFTLSLLIFISIHFISAYPNYPALNFVGDYCNITTASNCVTDTNGNKGYVIMGLSALTDSHGEFPYQSYPDVLCCHFGKGSTSCSPTPYSPTINVPQNKILGLSDTTNAHAEIPTNTNYNNNVCYSGISCVSAAACSDAYPINISSLTDTTNAHIGGYSNYTNNKICCGFTNTPGLQCKLTVVAFNVTSAVQGGNVPLLVNGTNCGGMTVNFTVTDATTGNIVDKPNSTRFPSSTIYPDGITYMTIQPKWNTPSATSGKYKLNATVYLVSGGLDSATLTTLTGSTQLTVSASGNQCSANCDQYTSSTLCQQDSCQAADATYNSGTYTADNPAPSAFSCNWTTSQILNSDGSVLAPANSCYYWDSIPTDSCQPVISGSGWGDCTGGIQMQVYNFNINSCPGFSLPSQTCNPSQTECNITYNGIVYPTTRLCGSSVVCGNGAIDQGEQCDGTNFGNLQCSNFDSYTGGSLTCNSNCQIDFSQCTPAPDKNKCGNGAVDSGEVCDGTNFTQPNGDILNCASQLLDNYTGTLSCSSNCLKISTTNCVAPVPSGCNVNDATRTNWSCTSWSACSAGQQTRTCLCGTTSATDSQTCSGPKINYCSVGTTLCYNQTSSNYLCLPYNCASSGDSNVIVPNSNADHNCGYGEGCGSTDCLYYSGSDTCVSSIGTALCNNQSNLCANPGGTTTPIGTNLPCGQGQTQCVYQGITGCYTGNSCPAGTSPTSASCSGTSPNATISCLPGFTCVNKQCSSNTIPMGQCYITTNIASGSTNNCQNGFITYNVVAKWVGTGNAPASCQSGTRTIDCPAQISLPAFTWINAVITVVVLALIYVAVVLARKRKGSKKKANSRRRKH